MTDWFTETGFGYLLGVAVVTQVGLLLVYRGLWGDRSKGRVRCPKCWYDMRGTVPRLECPECGHDAGEKCRLHKHHRRWGRFVIGVVLVLLSAYPLHIGGGWWREQSVSRTNPFIGFSLHRTGPALLVDRLPDGPRQFFDRVTEVYTLDVKTLLAVSQRLRHLRLIYAAGAPVTDADLVHMRGLSKLEDLNLSRTQVTDAGLVHLNGLLNLRMLYLRYVHVTDGGLDHLKNLPELRFLDLYGTQVTDEGVAKLQLAMPNVSIRR
jgi:hypothetical protein